MKRAQLLLLFFALIITGSVCAQSITIRGTIKDANGPLAETTVQEKGLTTNGTIADQNGKFSIALKGKTMTLVFKRVGYADQELKVEAGDRDIEVTMQPSEQGLDQVIVVGYGTKKRVTNTGAVSSISADAIRNIPTANVQNSLQGKLPGFFSVQRGGQPGRDASDFFIRGISSLNGDGNKPLIIVDDIEYTYEQLSQINVNEIESISILKDASTTAIYGIKGANGVLIVKTRRGALGVPKVNARVETGMQSPTKVPRFLNAYETASLVNEALSNDGLQPRFTQQDLDLYKSGDDPYGHPDVNWYDVVFKPFALQANTNVDISGGTDNVKYFISAGAFTQNGNLNDFTDPRNQGVKNNYFFRRYNFRSNLDIQATKSLKIRLDVTGRFGQINQPLFYPYFSNGVSGIMQEIYDFSIITPYAAPVLNPNGSYAWAYGPNLSNEPTINARLATMGYTRTSRTDFNTLFGVTEKLDFITRGLSFEGRLAYSNTSDITRTLQRGEVPPAFHYDPTTGVYTTSKHNNYTLSNFALRAGNNLFDKRVNLQAFLNYDRLFGEHHFSGMALLNQTNYTAKNFFTNQLQVPEKFQGFTLKLGYDFKRKYLLDFNAGYNGSDRFSAGNRFGFFPAVGVGWNLAEEKFFKDRFPFIQLFKLRGSFGWVGSDAVPDGRYLYEQFYYRGGGYSFGQSSNSVAGIYEGSLGNAMVSWEKARKKDIGLDVNMFKDKLSVTVDFFDDFRYDQLFYPGSISAILGVGFARENLASVRNRGWDGQVRFQDNIGKVAYDITAVFSYAKNKIVFQDEPLPAYPWLARTGHPIGQPFGYTWVGFYENQEDIDKSPKPNVDPSIIKPGDLKYADLNGDGVIDERDQGPIGKPNIPNTSLGITLGVHYKGLDVSVLFQGAFNYSFAVQGIGIEPFRSQMQPIHQLRWTPDNADNAKFPRLTSNQAGVSSPSVYPSTFWLLNAHYVRMKTVEIGYRLPEKLLPFNISNARLYFSAYNLFTWSNFSLYQQDPEISSNTAGDAYLNQRVMNLGIQVGF
ncbi:TonB-dependent receptor [Panacibacter sp. DH6]|uniref:TonB-dependent receptor n=1 Tax=Panacibacter microcysteis TaxID=2793269 RepID=A0A931H046_9BACT|nr:TonB-dependent receptor [Panacibacter microcysteis]MBG9378522.1 TonB-dependent receptor [Panacibacter microcysteis]